MQSRLAVIELALKAEPNNIDFRHLHGRIYSNMGMAQRIHEVGREHPDSLSNKQATAEAAVEIFEQAVAIRKSLADDYPAFRLHWQGLATAYGNLADALAIIDPNRETQERLRAVKIYEELAVEFPKVPGYRDALVLHVVRLADAYYRLRDIFAAVQVLQDYLNLGFELYNPEPTNVLQYYDLAVCTALLATETEKITMDEAACRRIREEAVTKMLNYFNTALECGLARARLETNRFFVEPAFDPYRDHPKFQDFASRLQQAIDEFFGH